MKLSVSLAVDDVAFIDEYAAKSHVPSRSAVIQRAVDLLRAAQLEDAYSAAWDEWEAEEESVWDTVAGDVVPGGEVGRSGADRSASGHSDGIDSADRVNGSGH